MATEADLAKLIGEHTAKADVQLRDLLEHQALEAALGERANGFEQLLANRSFRFGALAAEGKSPKGGGRQGGGDGRFQEGLDALIQTDGAFLELLGESLLAAEGLLDQAAELADGLFGAGQAVGRFLE